MKRALTLITFFYSSVVYGQLLKENPYKNIDGLTFAGSVPWKELLGDFCLTDGYGGRYFRLDSNMTFSKTEFSCSANFPVDKGYWTIKNGNTIVLKSKKHTLYFDIVRFDNFYFFILPTQRERFLKDLKEAKIKLKGAKPFIFDNNPHSSYFLIGLSLSDKYYAKEIQLNKET